MQNTVSRLLSAFKLALNGLIFRDIIVMLATQGWQKLLEDNSLEPTKSDTAGENLLCAIDRLGQHFQIPLEGAGINTSEIQSEFEALIGYASQFMSLSSMDYQSIWWHLFNAPTHSEWTNALSLAKLLFSLPMVNWNKYSRS